LRTRTCAAVLLNHTPGGSEILSSPVLYTQYLLHGGSLAVQDLGTFASHLGVEFATGWTEMTGGEPPGNALSYGLRYTLGVGIVAAVATAKAIVWWFYHGQCASTLIMLFGWAGFGLFAGHVIAAAAPMSVFVAIFRGGLLVALFQVR
jgi:hypothetical protein